MGRGPITTYATLAAALADYGGDCDPWEIVELAEGGFAHADEVFTCTTCGSHWTRACDLDDGDQCCDCATDGEYEADHRHSLADRI